MADTRPTDDSRRDAFRSREGMTVCGDLLAIQQHPRAAALAAALRDGAPDPPAWIVRLGIDIGDGLGEGLTLLDAGERRRALLDVLAVIVDTARGQAAAGESSALGATDAVRTLLADGVSADDARWTEAARAAWDVGASAAARAAWAARSTQADTVADAATVAWAATAAFGAEATAADRIRTQGRETLWRAVERVGAGLT